MVQELLARNIIVLFQTIPIPSRHWDKHFEMDMKTKCLAPETLFVQI